MRKHNDMTVRDAFQMVVDCHKQLDDTQKKLDNLIIFLAGAMSEENEEDNDGKMA